MIKLIKAIIFDMDGVVIDSEPFNYEVNRITFKKVGFKLSKKEFIEEWVVKGKGSRQAIKRHNIKISYEDLQKIKKKIYLDIFRREVKLKPNVKETIATLNKKYKLALASSAHNYNVDTIVKKFKFNEFFKVILGNQDASRAKPFPEIFLKAAKKLRVRPEDCLVIEDTEKGIIAAKRAGMKCIAIPERWTKKYNDFSRADLVLDSLKEVTIDIIESLAKGAPAGTKKQ